MESAVVIDGLLRIKRVREESREAEMRTARQQLEHAAAALRRATEERQRRDSERSEREQAMYRDVCSRVVVVRDLEDLRVEVAAMKEAAKADEKAVVDAQAQRQTRREAFDQATQSWRLAAHASQKFADLSAAQHAERAAHLEWLADLELEEHARGAQHATTLDDEPQEA